jgi:nucleotide-binding universal stress UspA family protein
MLSVPIRNIMVPICPGEGPERQLDAALKIARRVEGHVNAVFLRPDSATVYASLPNVARAAAVSLEAIEREAVAKAAAVRSGFDRWRTGHGLACKSVDHLLRSTYACWSEHIGPLEIAIVQQGRLSDLVVLNFPGEYHSASERAFDAAVFDTGRPVVLVPKSVPDELLRHVLIAWNGSLEVVRAVAGALPMLHAAERVSVFTAPWRNDDFLSPEDGMRELDLGAYLVWQGIRAGAIRAAPAQRSVGAALLQAAAEQEATMLVMGAFTRSRIRSLLLGGVTRHVLHNATIPVLMAH